MDFAGRKLTLWFEAVVLCAAGAALFVIPADAGGLWPWSLPPLSARFLGAGLLGVAAAAATVARWGEPRGLRALAVMGVGTLLVPLAGLLPADAAVDGGKLGIVAAFFGLLALVNAWLARGSTSAASWGTIPRPYLVYFAIHLAVAVPFGIALYLAPEAMAAISPWNLSPINIRLLAGVVFASTPLSLMALLDRDWAAAYPTAVAHAVFVTLATMAMLIHFGLFDAGRIRTWVFIGLYLAAAVVAGLATLRAAQARR